MRGSPYFLADIRSQKRRVRSSRWNTLVFVFDIFAFVTLFICAVVTLPVTEL